MNNKKGLMLSLLGIIGLIVITVGVTYAFFNYTKEGTTDNAITTGTITFLYTEVSGVGRGISIDDAFPISDTQGKAQTGEGKVFDFKVTSTTQMDASIPYEVTARKKATSTLDESAVKLYLTKVDGETETEILLAKYSDLLQTSKVSSDTYTEKTIYTGKVPANQANYEQNFRLRMWIDSDVKFSPNSDGSYPYNDKTFTVTVNVYANAKVVTEEDKELEANNDITSIQVGTKKAVESYSNSYDYEIGLDSGTTSTSLNIITESPDTTVKVESLDILAYGAKRLSSTKSITVKEGDNYFKITTTSLTGEEKISTINVRVGEYKESLLNQADPVLTDNLVPVIIKDNGEVQKVDTNYTWYDYETKYWANAVVLRSSDTYNTGDIIPEEAIESYFVWIPKYSYKLFDLGNYSSLTSIASKEQPISIRFGLTNTSDGVTGECTTPGTAGASGNCGVGEYMTHPAFLAFDTNGLWVGKFETGYDGATTTEAAATDVDKVDISKIIIKPNVYSWRNIKIGNMFENSYQYLRSDESHMMKNTEWGSVAYLSHSLYGTCEEVNGEVKCSEVRTNNNSAYITGYAGTEQPMVGSNKGESINGNKVENTTLGVDGIHTLNYLNTLSNIASNTGNYSGIYDLSGGAWDYVMGYTTGASTVGGSSEITSVHSDFFTNSIWNKYYDKYSSTLNTNYDNRILGDATGEIGTFAIQTDPDNVIRHKSSWYGDYAVFINSTGCWFPRGGYWIHGKNNGVFAFSDYIGDAHAAMSFRVVLAP